MKINLADNKSISRISETGKKGKYFVYTPNPIYIRERQK